MCVSSQSKPPQGHRSLMKRPFSAAPTPTILPSISQECQNSPRRCRNFWKCPTHSPRSCREVHPPGSGARGRPCHVLGGLLLPAGLRLRGLRHKRGALVPSLAKQQVWVSTLGCELLVLHGREMVWRLCIQGHPSVFDGCAHVRMLLFLGV